MDGAENTLESWGWGSTAISHDKGVHKSSHRVRQAGTSDPVCLSGQGGKGARSSELPCFLLLWFM